MSDTEKDEWLEETRAEIYTRMTHMKNRTRGMEEDLKKIDALIELRDESLRVREDSDSVRAQNDQLEAEVSSLRIENEELHSERGAQLDPD